MVERTICGKHNCMFNGRKDTFFPLTSINGCDLMFSEPSRTSRASTECSWLERRLWNMNYIYVFKHTFSKNTLITDADGAPAGCHGTATSGPETYAWLAPILRNNQIPNIWYLNLYSANYADEFPYTQDRGWKNDFPLLAFLSPETLDQNMLECIQHTDELGWAGGPLRQ